MNGSMLKGSLVLLVLAVMAPAMCVLAQEAPATYLSPLAVVADAGGATIYVAEATANRVAFFDGAAGSVRQEVALPKPPSGLALSADGARLYVACSAPAGEVAVIDTANGAILSTIAAGYGATAPVLSPDGARLYVCNRFNNDVSIIDLASGAVTARVPVLREPFAAAITPDGARLFVANHLPAGAGDGEYIASAVSVIDTASAQVSQTIAFPNGSTDLAGLCISPDGAFVYVSHILSRYHLPTTQLERGWMNTNALSVIDAAKSVMVNTVLLDSVDLGAANPWGVACTADGVHVCVAHAGTHEISVIDRAALHDKLNRVAAGERVTEVSQTPADVPNDLAFLVDVRRRIPLAGNGPRGVVMIGTKAYAAEYFTDSLGVVDVAPDVRAKAVSVALGPQTPQTAVRRGEMLFHDAALCFQHWQSCASCHPDARVDGFNWDLMNDGLGNPKNTKSMLLSHRTPPAMSLGVRDTAEVAVRAGIRFIQFAVRPEEDAVAIDEYLKALQPEPSPYLVNGAPGEDAVRGQAVFEKAGCAACHSGPMYTDMNLYDLGMGKYRDEGKPMDTPTLVEVWRTAPYLYDGRAATLRDVFMTQNPGDRHGVTSNLTPQEVDDLVAFVATR